MLFGFFLCYFAFVISGWPAVCVLLNVSIAFSLRKPEDSARQAVLEVSGFRVTTARAEPPFPPLEHFVVLQQCLHTHSTARRRKRCARALVLWYVDADEPKTLQRSPYSNVISPLDDAGKITRQREDFVVAVEPTASLIRISASLVLFRCEECKDEL